MLKLVPQWPTILVFNAAREDGSGSVNQNSLIHSKLWSIHHHQHTDTTVFHRLDDLPVA